MYLFRIITISFIVFILLFALWAIYDSHYNLRAIKGKHNEKLVKKLKTGYPVDSIITIMGEPYRVHYNGILPKGSVYCYESNNGDYLDINIELDSNKIIYRIFNPDEYE